MPEYPSVPTPAQLDERRFTDPVPEPRDAATAILDSARRIAVVGASDDPSRPSHGVMRSLLEVGFDVTPVTPTHPSVHGIPSVATLAEMDPPIDLVNVFRRAEHAPGVVWDAVRAGARGVWLQQGIVSAEARRIAEDAGLWYVENCCLGVEVHREQHRCEAPRG